MSAQGTFGSEDDRALTVDLDEGEELSSDAERRVVTGVESAEDENADVGQEGEGEEEGAEREEMEEVEGEEMEGMEVEGMEVEGMEVEGVEGEKVEGVEGGEGEEEAEVVGGKPSAKVEREAVNDRGVEVDGEENGHEVEEDAVTEAVSDADAKDTAEVSGKDVTDAPTLATAPLAAENDVSGNEASDKQQQPEESLVVHVDDDKYDLDDDLGPSQNKAGNENVKNADAKEEIKSTPSANREEDSSETAAPREKNDNSATRAAPTTSKTSSTKDAIKEREPDKSVEGKAKSSR